MIRRILIAILITACFMLAGLLLLAWRPSIAPIKPPSPSTFSAELVAKGEALSAVGHCAACHTQPGGQAFAGGYRINTPFGAIFWHQYHSGPENRYRSLVAGSFHPRDARRRGA